MNLVTEKWVPVVRMDGEPDFANLMQIFTEGDKFADLSVRPHERVALMRLLICIAQAALDGPKDKDDWKTAPDKLPDVAKKYLEKWEKEKSFNLFDKEKPFLQIAELTLLPKEEKEEKEKTTVVKDNDEDFGLTPLSKMDFTMATGANSTLFDHAGGMNTDRNYSLKSIPVMLLTFLNYLPGGIMSASKWGNVVDEGKSKDGKPTKGKTNGKDAPCSTKSMCHTFIRAENIFLTICCNLIPKSIVNRQYGENNWGIPVWEKMPKNHNDTEAVENATKTYLGRLVPMSRWIKIIPEKGRMIWSAGKFIFPTFEDNFPCEPTATTVKNFDQTERFLLSAKHDKAIWRELSSILVKGKNNIGGPLAFENPLPKVNFDVHVCALIRSKASIEAVIEAVYNVSPNMLSDDGRSLYEDEVLQAERLTYSLGRAVEIYRQNIDGYWDQRIKLAGKDSKALKNKLHSKATRFYWTAVEKQRYLLMACVDVFGTDELEPARQAWGKVLHKAARDAYIVACGQETPRQIRAFALGWKKLFAEKKVEEVDGEKNTDGGEE